MEEKKKSNIGLIIFITLIIGLLIGVGEDYYIRLKNQKNQKISNQVENVKKETSKKEDTKNLDIYSDQVQDLYNQLSYDSCDASTIKMYKENNVSLEELQKYSVYLGLNKYLEKNNKKINEVKSFTYDELNNNAKEIFGKKFNMEVNENTWICNFKYDSATKTFVTDPNGGCGCTSGPEGPEFTLYKATATGDTIQLYEAVVFGKLENNSYNTYYTDSNYTNYSEACTLNSNRKNTRASKKCIDESTKYEYTFTLEDDKYILTNISFVK